MLAAGPVFGAPRKSPTPAPVPEVGRSGNVDVVIVGAGAAGIAAARRLAAAGKRFALVEAADTVGGRCITDSKTFGIPYDRGAHWIYTADINPVAKLAPQTGLDLYPAPPGQRMRIGRRFAREGEMEDFLAGLVRTNGAIADAARGRADVSCAQALPKDLGEWRPSIEFVLGPYGASKELAEISAVDFSRGGERDNGAFCRQGLGALIAKLAPAAVQLATPATQIEWWSRTNVFVTTSRGRFDARAAIVTVSTNVLTSGKIKFAPELPKRVLDAAARLKLGSLDHVALEFTGNPLGLRRDELMFEKSESNRTAAVLANVSGSTLCVIDVGGKFGRELSDKGEAADDRVRGRLARRALRHRYQERRQAQSRDPLEPRAVGAGRVLGGCARRAALAQGADGAAQQPRLPGRRGRARDAVGHRRRRLGIGRARRRRGGAPARRQARVTQECV